MQGGERMTLRDLAKFGQLLLSGGNWNGRQVVPAKWISDTLNQGTTTGWSWTSSVGDEPLLQRPSVYRFKWFQTSYARHGQGQPTDSFVGQWWSVYSGDSRTGSACRNNRK